MSKIEILNYYEGKIVNLYVYPPKTPNLGEL